MPITVCQVCQATALKQRKRSWALALPVGQPRTHKPDNALLRFLLRHRLPARYAADSHVAPGHPLYERIREEVLEPKRRQRKRDEAAIFASIDAKLAKIRTRRTAAREERAGSV